MTLTVDCNNDVLTIERDTSTMQLTLKRPNEVLNILFSVIDAVIAAKDSGQYVSLVKIDEDSRTTIEEW